jgi:ABC-2 type transport system ATP-binding protein
VTLLELAQVSKRFGAREVLRGLSFSVRAGEVYGLLGANGAGKSTTFRIICDLAHPDSGSARFDGAPVAGHVRGRIGVVAQQIALYQNLTCAENLEFFGQVQGLFGRALRARADACLAQVGLTERRGATVRELSGGMQRRLHVAAALVHSPKLVILDEPSTGLDLEARHEQWRLIRALRAGGTAVLLTTHLLDEAEELCDRVGILHAGHILAEGSPEELRARIPAVEIAIVRTPEPEAVKSSLAAAGITVRARDQELVLWLPEKLELRALVALLGDAPVDSLSRRPVQLADAYVELTSVRASRGD